MITGINYILKYIKTVILNCKYISQYYWMFYQINADFVSIKDFFQKNK